MKYTLPSITILALGLLPATAQTPAADIDRETTVAPAADLSDESISLDDSVGERIFATDSFSRLQTIIEAADFQDRLDAAGPITFFAPKDSAFDDLPEERFNELLVPSNKERLVKLLERHLLEQEVEADAMSTGAVKTTSGEKVMVVVDENSVNVGEAGVTLADMSVSNGVIHMVDSLLVALPEETSQDSSTEQEATEAEAGVVSGGVSPEESNASDSAEESKDGKSNEKEDMASDEDMSSEKSEMKE